MTITGRPESPFDLNPVPGIHQIVSGDSTSRPRGKSMREVAITDTTDNVSQHSQTTSDISHTEEPLHCETGLEMYYMDVYRERGSLLDERFSDDTFSQDHPGPVTEYQPASNTLIIEEIPLRLDLQLGDDELGVGLLIESLEEQYRAMQDEQENDPDQIMHLQSAKEWASSHRERLAGLFRYLKELADD